MKEHHIQRWLSQVSPATDCEGNAEAAVPQEPANGLGKGAGPRDRGELPADADGLDSSGRRADKPAGGDVRAEEGDGAGAAPQEAAMNGRAPEPAPEPSADRCQGALRTCSRPVIVEEHRKSTGGGWAAGGSGARTNGAAAETPAGSPQGGAGAFLSEPQQRAGGRAAAAADAGGLARPSSALSDAAAALGAALHAAVARRDAREAERLLARGANPDDPDWAGSGDPPLLRAAAAGDLPTVRALLAAGCCANARTAQGETALQLAARGSAPGPLLGALLEAGCDPRLQDGLRGRSPLHELCSRAAAAAADPAALARLAGCSGVANLRDHRARTALHRLVEAGWPDPEPYRVLLRAGADANLQDGRGQTALLAALERAPPPAPAVLRLLAAAAAAEAGAGAGAGRRLGLGRATAYGETALHLAARRGRADLVALLLQHGAPPNARDLRGNTPLHLAAGRGYAEVAALLLTAPGARCGAANADGFTALHAAVDSGFVPVVKILLSNEECDLQAQTNMGQTALDLAQQEYRRRSTPEMALLLIKETERRKETRIIE